MKKLKLEKYLEKIQLRRKVETNHIAPTKMYKLTVVIPVYGEHEYIGKTLHFLSANSCNYLDKTLVLLVINNPVEGANIDYVEENQYLLRELKNGFFQEKCLSFGQSPSILSSEKQLSFELKTLDNPSLNPLLGGDQKRVGDEHQASSIEHSVSKKSQLNRLNLAWIDASSNGRELPGRGGVGMARKLGMDSVLNFLSWDNDPIIISLDADTLVEKNYLAAIECFFYEHKDIAAASVNFKHLPGKTPEEEKAIREYEYSIRYYVESLKRAGSPYAYYSIGSAMVCRADAYIRAGGMKQHRGGEDFYFMQGLRKLGPIMEITDTKVYQSARPSDRVPFGTGPKVQKCLNGTELKLYNSKIFDVLKETLQMIENWINAEDVTDLRQFVDFLPEEANDYFNSLKFYLIWPNILKNNVKGCKELSINDRKRLLWAFHVWFDAFKTLKFIHYLERNYPKTYSKTDIAYIDVT